MKPNPRVRKKTPTKIIPTKDYFGSFQKIFIYFWVFSLLGHYVEVVWSSSIQLINGSPLVIHPVSTIIPLAAPYGLGAIAVILLVWPLIKARKVNPLTVFVLNIIITGTVEYICAAIVILIFGHLAFWNYSKLPFNINGYVCLESATLFSIMATLFLYFIYPFSERIIQSINRRTISITFWILFIAYITDLLHSFNYF